VSASEKETEDVLAVPEAAAFVCDATGIVRWWSDSAERLLGYYSAEALGKSLAELLAPEPAAPSGRAPQVWHVARRDGIRLQLWHTTSTLRNRNGESLSLQLVWPQASARAVGAGTMDGGALAARIAQDFNRLLAPVIGSVILLEEEISPQHSIHRRVVEARRATEDARGFAQRLGNLDPKRKMTLVATSLGQIVHDLLPGLKADLPSNIDLVAKLDDCRDGVLADRKHLTQVVLQLVLNAKEAMPAGGHIRLTLTAVDGAEGTAIPAGRWVCLEVSDDGKGMDATLLGHAFEPFVTTKSPSCGVGLGLTIVRAVLRQHGGFFNVRSHPGQGTSVAICLPSHGPLADNSNVENTAKPTGAATVSTAAKANILVVEDNAMVRRSIEATLRSFGYHVIAVPSGDACIATIKAAPSPVDLLITDVVMPEMSGKELIERLHALQPELPVLFMSGYDRSTLASRRQSVAAEHFLQKPFDSEDLAAAVVRVMSARDLKTKS
jgi:two-component system, cell cycle sensor histidine kinase and response regulator CckA